MRFPLILLLALAVFGCELDLTEPETTAPARLAAHVSLQDSSSEIRVFATGTFARGRDSTGSERRVADSVLRVMGISLAASVGRAGVLTYEGEFRTSGTEGVAVTVEGPALTGASGELRPSIRAVVPWRVSGPNLQVRTGDSVSLGLAVPGTNPEPPPTDAHWTLRIVVAPDTVVALVSARGLPPQQLSIPWSWVRTVTAPSLTVELQVFQAFAVKLGQGSYTTNVVIEGQMRWFVSLVTP